MLRLPFASDRLLALGLAVLGDPSAQLLGIEAAGAAKLVAGELAGGGLVVDLVLVHPEQLGDLAGGHHRLHRCSFSVQRQTIA
jgi:hypothetical protein